MDALQVHPPVCVPDVKAQRLPYERVCPEEGATGDDQTERFLNLRKKIWDNITEVELKDIKEYLKMHGNSKIGRAKLEKVTTCVELLPLLQDRCLFGIDNLSFIKKLLLYMKRFDLLKVVDNYEKESAKAAGAIPRRPKSDLRYAPSDSTCESRHLQQSIKLKNIEIQQHVQHQTNSSDTLENLKKDMKEQTEIISRNGMKLTGIDRGKKQKQENERKCRDKQIQIEAKIKQLQEAKREELDLERSLLDDIDRMSREHREVEYIISEATYKNNELSKRYEDEFRKEKELSKTINNLELELHNLKLQINQRSEIHQYQPRHRPNSNNNDEVQASPRSSVGGEEDRKSEKSERSGHSEPQEPEPEVEAVVTVVNEVEIEKDEKLASEHLPRNCKVTKRPHFQGYGFILRAKQDRVGQFIDKIHDDSPADAASLKEGDIIIEVNGVNIENETHQQVFQRIKAGGDQTTLLVLDREGDDYYKSKGMTISSELSIVRQCSNTPTECKENEED